MCQLIFSFNCEFSDPSWNYLIGEFRLTHRGRGPTRRELTAMWQQSQNQILMQEKARMAAAAALARTTAATRHIPPPPSTTGGQTEAQAAARAAYVAQQKHLFSDDSIRTNSR